jgi:hypothetical protein
MAHEDRGTFSDRVADRLLEHLAQVAGTDPGAELGRPSALSGPNIAETIAPGGTHNSYIRTFRMLADRVPWFRGLVELIYLIAQSSYKQGHREGRDLIGGLASGDLTLKEVDKATLREEGG